MSTVDVDDAALTARFQSTLPYHLFGASRALASLHASRNQLLNGGPKPTPSSCTRCGNFFASCTLLSKRQAQRKSSKQRKGPDAAGSTAEDIHFMIICRTCGKKDTKSVRDVPRQRRMPESAVRAKSGRKARTTGKEISSSTAPSANQTLATARDALAPETEAPSQVKEKKLLVQAGVPWKTPSSSKATVAGGPHMQGVRSSAASITSNGSSPLPPKKARGGLEGMLERNRQQEARKQPSGGSKLSDFLHELGPS